MGSHRRSFRELHPLSRKEFDDQASLWMAETMHGLCVAPRDLLITTANSFPQAECLLNIVPGIADSKHTISSCVLRTWSLLLCAYLCVAGLVFQHRLFPNLLSACAGSVCTIHNFRNRNNLDSAIHGNGAVRVWWARQYSAFPWLDCLYK